MIGAAGYCDTHKMAKMFVGTDDATEPTCVRCVADSKPKEGRTQIVEDPGEDYFSGKGSNAKITVLDKTHGAGIGVAEVVKLHQRVAEINMNQHAPLEAYVKQALEILTHAPMPHDIKQFKNLQKVIGILKGLVENQNG